MEHLSNQTKKTAQPVEEQTQKKETEPSMGIEIPKKALALAKSVGIDLKPIVQWASSVEARFKLMEQEMPKKVIAELQRVVAQRRQEQIKQIEATGGTGQTSEKAMMMQILAGLAGGGGGGSDEMMQSMMKTMFQRTITGIDLSNALTKAMIIKLAPELANSLTKTLVKKE